MSLKEQFRAAAVPDPSELRGSYEVRLVTRFLPAIRFFGHRKFFPDDTAIENGGLGGYNEFFGRIRIGSFKIDRGLSMLGDGQEVLRIIYNRKGNNFFLRILTDEVKRLGPGEYLGRGVISMGRLVFNSFYFSLKGEGA
ncbi:MAG: hypothetical protein JW838_05705 [Spirochaetes bacterium]|nr:hypothetical protein [Spirochaetota bacterium]